MFKSFFHSVPTSLLLVLAFGILANGMATVSFATPPPRNTCDTAPSANLSPGGDTKLFDRVKCKHDAVLDQVMHAATVLEGFSPSPGQQRQIDEVKGRATRTKNVNKQSIFEKASRNDSKSHREPCYFIPMDGFDDDGNGRCDFDSGEKCLAIELDDAGNQQECNPKKKNRGKDKGLECDEICGEDDAQDKSSIEEAGREMERGYEALEENLIELNNELESIPLTTAKSVNYISAKSTSCKNVPSDMDGLSIAAATLRSVAVAARAVLNVMEKSCNQVIVVLGSGGNTSAACTPLAITANVTEVAYTIVDELVKDRASALQKNILDCSKLVKKDVTDAKTSLETKITSAQTSIEGKVESAQTSIETRVDQGQTAILERIDVSTAAIMTNDDANTAAVLAQIEEVIRLLNTPPGQRDEFPKKP